MNQSRLSSIMSPISHSTCRNSLQEISPKLCFKFTIARSICQRPSLVFLQAKQAQHSSYLVKNQPICSLLASFLVSKQLMGMSRLFRQRTSYFRCKGRSCPFWKSTQQSWSRASCQGESLLDFFQNLIINLQIMRLSQQWLQLPAQKFVMMSEAKPLVLSQDSSDKLSCSIFGTFLAQIPSPLKIWVANDSILIVLQPTQLQIFRVLFKSFSLISKLDLPLIEAPKKKEMSGLIDVCTFAHTDYFMLREPAFQSGSSNLLKITLLGEIIQQKQSSSSGLLALDQFGLWGETKTDQLILEWGRIKVQGELIVTGQSREEQLWTVWRGSSYTVIRLYSKSLQLLTFFQTRQVIIQSIFIDQAFYALSFDSVLLCGLPPVEERRLSQAYVHKGFITWRGQEGVVVLGGGLERQTLGRKVQRKGMSRRLCFSMSKLLE